MRNQKPSWWQLYAIVPLMFGALLLSAVYGVRGDPGKIIDAAILVAGFGAMLLWVNANQAAMWDDEISRDAERRASKRKENAPARRSPSGVTPRVPLRESSPHTGFGSARGKRYGIGARTPVTRDIVRVSRIRMEE